MTVNSYSSPGYESFVRECATLSGLIILVYDMLWSCDKEYQFVFETPTTRIKWLYVLSRCLGLTFQIANLVIIMGPLSEPPVSPNTCQRWFYFQLANFVSLLALVEIILVLRVYALYQKNWAVGAILSLIFMSEMVTIMVCAFKGIPRLHHDAVCIIMDTPKPAIEAGVLLIFTQSISWGLALWKYKMSMPEGWSNALIVALVIRDGGLYYLGLCTVLLLVMPISLRVKDLTFLFFSFISCLSIVGCRLIINMQQLRRPQLFLGPEFTSVLELTGVEMAQSSVEYLSGLDSVIP